jgi:Zn-dependent protease with chaperone function
MRQGSRARARDILASEGATVALTEEDLSRGIHGVVGPIRRRGRFGLGLVLTAVATLILPLIYLAVVLATCYVVYLHLVHDTWLIETLTLWRLVAYLGPALTGGVVVFFLWKPILARPVQVESGVRVERSEAPLLFKFVDLIQAAVGAPPPSEIRIDALVNASASFRRGFWSFARRSDLTLTIGMPLLAGLTARQLGGVLGHELGHFAQGSGMRLTYLIRSINGWLVRVAYERDSWDDALAREAKQAHWSISLPLQAGQLAVLASRKLLAGLAMGGHVIGTFLQRELEMDADRYEVGVAGSDVFEATARRMRVLTVARSGALDVTTAEWREGRLPDDFSGLVVALAERIPEEIRAKIESLRPEGSIFDTHPPDERRIASAKAERAAGILTLEAPALALLGEASPLRERVSRALYQHGFVSGRGQLRPLAELLSRLDARHAQVGAAERYFGEIFDLLEPMGAPAVSPASSLAAGLEWLSEARETSLRLRGDKDRADAARVAARERLAATLALLYLPEVRARLGDADAVGQEAAQIVGTLGVLAAERPAIAGVTAALGELSSLSAHAARQPENAALDEQMMGKLGRLHVDLQKLEQRLSHAPYPFDHVKGALSIAGYVTHGLPDVDGLGPQVQGRALALLDRLAALHNRALGRLAVLAERIEQASQSLAFDGRADVSAG